MREIPPLQVISLRSVGSHACSVEDTFASRSDHRTTASRLLRSFHRRPVLGVAGGEGTKSYNTEQSDHHDTDVYGSIDRIPMERTPCIGAGGTRRLNANHVDLHHPVIGTLLEVPTPGQNTASKTVLVTQYGNPALDLLQSYIDALCELGRMDDRRLGRNFFEEFKANILQSRPSPGPDGEVSAVRPEDESSPSPQKRRRRRSMTPILTTKPPSLGSLSLFNCSIGADTLEALESSGLGLYLAVLDLTGVNGLTDQLCSSLLKKCPHLERLSLKNGRRLTCDCLQPLVDSTSLTSLDVGGCYNISLPTLLKKVLSKLPALDELHAGGLGWTDDTVGQLVELPDKKWITLSLGFSGANTINTGVTAGLLRQHLLLHANTLSSLALPFCESLVDNALMGMLGRNLPNLQYMDMRGNPALQTLTGWYDGRASADLQPQRLVILARYTSITAASVDETKRIHPLETLELTVVLDGGGMGLAIPQREDTGNA